MRIKINSHPGCRRLLIFLLKLSLLFSYWEQGVWAARQPEFVATQIHEANEPVYGLAWGDFDPCSDGMEIACLLQYGSILRIAPDVPHWRTNLIHKGNTDSFSMFLRPTIGIGDVHSGYPGNEIVISAGRSSAKVTMIFYEPAAEWSSEVLYDNSGYIGGCWGARVGDYDPCRPGDEILHIYEGILDCSTGTIFSEEAGLWKQKIIYGDGEWAEVGMDSAAGEFNPEHTGPEIAVVTEMGPAYEIIAPDSTLSANWPRRTIWDDFTNAGWVVEIADIDPCHPGNELVYGTRYSNSIAMSRHNSIGLHDFQVLFTGNASEGAGNMWDIAVGDVLPESEGLEILGVDETGSVYLVRRNEKTWQGQVIWQDSNSLYAVAAADFLPVRDGDEILVAGESGILTLLTLTFKDSIAGDGTVNFQDFAHIAHCWYQNVPSADIGPWPIGDGLVDLLDVAVLAENWLQTAYWLEQP